MRQIFSELGYDPGKLIPGGDEQEQGGTGSRGVIDFRPTDTCRRAGSKAASPLCRALSRCLFPEARLSRHLSLLIHEGHCIVLR